MDEPAPKQNSAPLPNNMQGMVESYVDRFSMSIDPYGLSMILGTSMHGNHEQWQGRFSAKMSMVHAKLMVILMKRTILGYEDQTGGPIKIPAQLLHESGLSPHEDW